MNSEEIKQMKGVNESEASWQRRKKFLIVCQSKFPKERLNTLSYCYVNVFLHKCTYSEKLMDDLYKMACDVANYQWDDPVNMSKWTELFDESLGVPVSGEKRKGKPRKTVVSSINTSVSCHDDTLLEKYVSPILKLKKSVGFEHTKSCINKLNKIVTTKPKCNIKHVRKNVTSVPQKEKSLVSGQKKIANKSLKTELGKVVLSEKKSPKKDMGKVDVTAKKSPKTDIGKVALYEQKAPKTEVGMVALHAKKSPKTNMGKVAVTKEKSPKTEVCKVVLSEEKSPKTEEVGKVVLSEQKLPKTEIGEVAVTEKKSPKTDVDKVVLMEQKSPKKDVSKVALNEPRSSKTGKVASYEQKSPKTEMGKIISRKLVCDTLMSVFNQSAPTNCKIKSCKLNRSQANVNQQCTGTKNDNTTKNGIGIAKRKVTIGQNCCKENITANDNQYIRNSDNTQVTRTNDSCILKNSQINKSQRWKNRVILKVKRKLGKKKSANECNDTTDNIDLKQNSYHETPTQLYASESLISQKLNVNEKQQGKKQISLDETCNTKLALGHSCTEDFDVIKCDNGPMMDINNNLEPSVKNKNIDKSEIKTGQEGKHSRMFVNWKYKGNRGNSLATVNPSTFDGTYMSGYSTGTPKHVKRVNHWPYTISDVEGNWLGSGSWFGQGYSFPFYDSYVQYGSSYIPHSPVGNPRSGRIRYEGNFQQDNPVGRKYSSQSEYLFPKSVTDMTKNILEFRGKQKTVLHNDVPASADGENLLINFKTALIPELNLEKNFKKLFDKKEDVFKFEGSGTTRHVSRKTTKNKEKSECLRKNPDQATKSNTLVTERSKTAHDIWLKSVLDQINKT